MVHRRWHLDLGGADSIRGPPLDRLLEFRERPAGDSPRFARNTSFSEISRLGPLPLFIPVLIAATGLWGAWRRRRLPLGIATTLMLFFVVLTSFSVGSAYLPAVGALAWALVAELDAS